MASFIQGPHEYTALVTAPGVMSWMVDGIMVRLRVECGDFVLMPPADTKEVPSIIGRVLSSPIEPINATTGDV